MRGFQGSYMSDPGIILLLLAHLQSSSSDQNLLPCLGEYSVILEGDCVQCLRPNYLNCPQAYNGEKLPLSANNISILRELCPEQIFKCSTDPGLIEERRINKGKRFLNMRTLRVVTIERPPWVRRQDGEFVGVVFDLLYALRDKYNFTAHVFPPYDGNWGAKDANGKWNGMVGQVFRKEADLGAAVFSVTEERGKVVDFTTAFHQEPSGILIPAPTAGNKLTTLIKPFTPEVWLMLFLTVIVLGPFLFVIHLISLRLRGLVAIYKSTDGVRLITDLFQFIIGSLVQESLISPVNRTTKFLVVVWWFLTLVLANVYTGVMVSLLSVPKLYDIVDSLEGLVQQTKLRWTYRKNAALEDLFQSNLSSTYNAIAAGARDGDLVSTDAGGLEKVLGGGFAFIKEKSYLDVAIENDFNLVQQCRVTVASGTFFNIGFAFVVQKGSAFLDLIDVEILKVVTTGLMEKWKSRHWPHNLQCVNAASYIISTQPKSRRLTLDDCQGAYFILVCGVSLATIGYLLELAYYRISACCRKA